MQAEKNMERYQRQMLLPGFGKEGQEKLFAARVLVIGAGGLGCPALLYLAATGVGRLGIVDFDEVSLSNLHRQVLFNQLEVGQPKAEVAAQKIRSAYPDTQVEVYNTRLDTRNALDIVAGYDLVVDGSDNFPTRYLVNDACVLLGKPLVYGSVYRFEGQVAVFNYAAAGKQSTSYRDLFPQPPGPDEVPNCAEAGVLGILPGIISSLQVNEAIKLLCALGEPLVNKLLTYDSLRNSFYEIAFEAHSEAQSGAPKNRQEFESMQYEQFCGHTSQQITEISPATFNQLAQQQRATIIDVRNEWEQPKMNEYPVLHLPLDQLESRLKELENSRELLVFCQAGARSLQAARLLQAHFSDKKVYSLQGGITAWSVATQNKNV